MMKRSDRITVTLRRWYSFYDMLTTADHQELKNRNFKRIAKEIQNTERLLMSLGRSFPPEYYDVEFP
jgi:hypothetical protein